MRKLFSLLMVSAVVACFAAPSFAADKKADKPKPNPEEAFKKMDKNNDGSLTEAEFLGKREGEKAEAAKKMFAAKDANKDGKLSLEEFTAKVKKPK